jgi:hypothetical protein
MATNVPPPIPRKKVSPLVWILITIAGLFAFGVIAVTSLGFFAYHKAKQAGFDVSLLEKKPELALLKMAVAANPDAEIVSLDERRGIATIRDRKSGKVVTLNFEDIKKGRISFEQENKGEGDHGSGSATFAAGAVKLPAWLPAYSGATPEGFATEGQEGSSGSFSFKTGDDTPKVAAFYEAELKKAGFTVETTPSASGSMLNAESGTRKAVINILADGSGSSVNGTFEEKN